MRRSLAALLCALASCSAEAEPGAPPVPLDAAAEPLRAQFDAAAGKVRAILLPAPT